MHTVKRHALGLAVSTLLLAAGANAEDPAAAPSAAPAVESAPAIPPESAGPHTVVLHANSLIGLRLLEAVSSETNKTGDTFALEVTDDVTVDGVVVIPTGSKVEGQVIHAARSGMLGKAGELLVTSRFVVVGERKVKLHTLLAGTGQNRIVLALFIWPFATGKKVIIPAGTELAAKIAQDEVFSVPPASK